MVEVRKAYADDFEGILPLLMNFNKDVSIWRNLFINHWNHKENYFGFVVTDEEKIVGFLGGIFSSRIIRGQQEKFCNLSTWIIDEKYKKHGLSLFLPVLELDEYTITNFSSAEKTYIISKKLGFEDIEPNLQYFIPTFRSRTLKGLSIELDPLKIEKVLKGEDLKIFKDHLNFQCHHIYINHGDEYSYLVVKQTQAFLKPVYYVNRFFQKIFKTNFIQEHALLGQLHYVSNKSLFQSSLGSISWEICRRLKIIGLVANAAWLGECKGIKAWPYKTFSSPLFRSTSLKKEDIDTMYSEVFIINA
ncbi:hypothetical protein [Rufibacter soli]